MDFAEYSIKRIEGDKNLKKPLKALICFSKPTTGVVLGRLIINILKSNPDNSSIVALNMVDEDLHRSDEEINRYKSELFGELIQECEKNSIRVRTLLKVSSDFVTDILSVAKEYDCNFLLMGVGSQVIDPAIWKRYTTVFENEPGSEAIGVVGSGLKSVASLLRRSPIDMGVFMDNNFTNINNVFTPLLHKEDVSIFPYLFQVAQSPKTKVTIWDAIGVINSDQKIQSLFQYMNKKTDNRVVLWDNEKKIEHNFITQQSLVIIGVVSWDKLIGSAISWSNILPSTLIIKEETSSL